MPDTDQNEASEIVRTYLRLSEARDLDAATALLAPGVRITFPGGRVFDGLSEQVVSSGTRFRSVRKNFEEFDTAADGEHIVVYVFGTLEGTAMDGTAFAGVRFIDRFELEHGQILTHMVWNDLAEQGVVAPSA